VNTSDFDYVLPQELIAQAPAPERDASRLMHLNRQTGHLEHRVFRDIVELLRPGDLLVMNNSRVIRARLRGMRETGGQFEILLLSENGLNDWWVMMKPAGRVKPGALLRFTDINGAPSEITATVHEKNPQGHVRLQFAGTSDLHSALEYVGEVPLPPYIAREQARVCRQDAVRYQTVYADPPGSVAAPTAGLHFTVPLLSELKRKGVETQFVTLHVGPGTFAPVKVENLDEHPMHEERFELSAPTAVAIQKAQRENRRVVAVGTTSVRVLESAASLNNGRIVATKGATRLFIHPPYDFKVVNALVTNFHLPKSTLLMLVSAMAAPGRTTGRELVLGAYAEAIRERYRFFSYGDAMFID